MTIEAVQNYNRMMAPVFTDMESLPVFTFFNTLFSTGDTVISPDAEAIDIDIQRGNKKKAAYITRGTDAVSNGDTQHDALLEKYTSDSKLFPLIEEETPITSTMILKRMPGENPYSPLAVPQKQAVLGMKAHREHMRRIIRQLEYSASESFRTGVQTIMPGVAYDFYRRASHNQNAVVVWSTSATADPNGDLSAACNKVARDGNRTPTDVIMGEGAWENYINTTQVKDLADSRRIIHFASDMNAPNPGGYDSWVAAGAIFQGQVKVGNYKLNIWTYPAIYDDAAGAQTQYMPDAQVVVMAKGARYDRYFGPADRLAVANNDFYRDTFGINLDGGVPSNVMNSGLFRPEMFHLDAYGGNNNKSLMIRSQIAPIFPTIETDTIVKIETE